MQMAGGAEFELQVVPGGRPDERPRGLATGGQRRSRGAHGSSQGRRLTLAPRSLELVHEPIRQRQYEHDSDVFFQPTPEAQRPGGEPMTHRSTWTDGWGSVGCRYLYTGLEPTGFGEALDRFDLCVVVGDALGCQMWVVEARSRDDSDTLDCSGFHAVHAVRLRTTIACQPDDRWRNSLNRHGGFSICFRHAGSRGRVHPRVPDWRNGIHENAVLCTFNCKNVHQSDHCALGRSIGRLATHSEEADN